VGAPSQRVAPPRRFCWNNGMMSAIYKKVSRGFILGPDAARSTIELRTSR
jgi:hypothetical protein